MINELLHWELNWALKNLCLLLSVNLPQHRDTQNEIYISEIDKVILTQAEAWYSQSRFPKVPDRQKQRKIFIKTEHLCFSG